MRFSCSFPERVLASVWATALFAALVASAAAEGRRGIAPVDYYSLDAAADPHISPDGKLVAYTVTGIDGKLNRKISQIWMAALDGSRQPWPFTDAESATSPRWSPDGRALAFISARHDPRTGALERAQVYLLSMSGGEARRITDFKNGVSALQWSPDGTRLACTSRLGPEDAAPTGKERDDVKDYTNPEYKADGKGFYDTRRDHIFVVDVKTGGARQLTFGDQRNDGSPAWSPDSARIAYLTARTDMSLLQDGELNIVSAAGGTPTRISAPETSLGNLRWSPDGQSLAYTGATGEEAIIKIWISPVNGGKYRLASETVTYPGELDWSEDSKSLYFTGAFRGEHPLFRLNLATGKPAQLASGVVISSIDIDQRAGKIVYASASYEHPGDIYAADLEGKPLAQVTHLNRKLLSELDLQPIERLPFKGADGLDVEGFFVKPVGWQPGKSYPMILMIHGGPNGMWGTTWNLEAETYAAHGWAVLMTNPRGSSGYGEAFQRAVNLQWGGKAYQDIMAGVDAAIAKYPWVDRERLGVTGQSFGGFMTDWIVGQTTRFKGAVTLSGISDFISVEGTRDGFYGHDRDFGGDLWKAFDLFWQYSPVRNAPRVKTPVLILHGDSDQRVPLGQGEEFFRALYHFGVPTELVIFPREAHSLRTEPKHAVEVLKWQTYWFERYVAGNTAAVKPNAE